MREYRDYRLIIPGAVFILTIFILLYPDGFLKSETYSKLFGSNQVSTLIALLVGSYVGGFIFGNFVSVLSPYCGFFIGPKKDHKKVKILKKVFEKNHMDFLKNVLKEDDKDIYPQSIIDECDTRTHCHAPNNFINFCSRRQTTVWTSLNCLLAFIFGAIATFAVLIPMYIDQSFGLYFKCYFIAKILLIFLICFTLYRHARKADDEHWSYYCKFIEWDLKTNRPEI